MARAQQRAFQEDRSRVNLESPDGLIVEEIDLSKTTLSLNLDSDGQQETNTATAEDGSSTSEELSSRIKERENEISRLKKIELRESKVAKRLSKTVEEITQSQNSTEDNSTNRLSIDDFLLGGLVLLTVSGVGAAFGSAGGRILGSTLGIGGSYGIWGAIIGGVLTVPTIVAGFWIKETKPFSSDYEEFRGVCKKIEGVAEEERLTPEYRLKLYSEAAELYKRKQKKVEQEISDLQKANSADQKLIDKFIEEDKGKLPDRFKNAKIKLGIEQGELLPSPSEIKAKAKLLWNDEGLKRNDV